LQELCCGGDSDYEEKRNEEKEVKLLLPALREEGRRMAEAYGVDGGKVIVEEEIEEGSGEESKHEEEGSEEGRGRERKAMEKEKGMKDIRRKDKDNTVSKDKKAIVREVCNEGIEVKLLLPALREEGRRNSNLEPLKGEKRDDTKSSSNSEDGGREKKHEEKRYQEEGSEEGRGRKRKAMEKDGERTTRSCP